jgi:Protein of unknown function (Hypoth_ymh)
VTDPPQSSDGSPAVAALATHVNALRRDLKSLTVKVDVLTSTQREQAIVLNGIAELRRQVEQVLAILAEEDDASPAAWFWLTMTDQERDEKFGELSDWVETAMGTFQAIRNPAHHLTGDWNPITAFEYLAALSTVARWVTGWNLVQYVPPPIDYQAIQQAMAAAASQAAKPLN